MKALMKKIILPILAATTLTFSAHGPSAAAPAEAAGNGNPSEAFMKKAGLNEPMAPVDLQKSEGGQNPASVFPGDYAMYKAGLEAASTGECIRCEALIKNKLSADYCTTIGSSCPWPNPESKATGDGKSPTSR